MIPVCHDEYFSALLKCHEKNKTEFIYKMLCYKYLKFENYG